MSELPERLSWIALAAPFGVAVYLAFNAGGFFAGTTAVAATVLLGILALRILTGEHPVAGANPAIVIASAALAGFAVWVLLSYLWSDSPARALLEFDRMLVYLPAFWLTGLLLQSRRRVQVAVWAALAALAAIAGAGLLSWVLPDAFPTDPSALSSGRLSHPVTYWNGFGLIAAFGIILAIAVASDRRQPALARPPAAALAVPLAAALYFTLSRGAIAACILGLVAFAVAGRPRQLLTTLLSVGPFAAAALVVSYQADLLTTDQFASPAGADQGRTVALVVLAAMVAAGGVQALTMRLDSRLEAVRLPERARRPAQISIAAAAVVALVVCVAALDAPATIERQVDRFIEGGDVNADSGDARSRLTDFSNNRSDHWRVAADAWRDRPAVGQGAGTFSLEWARMRPNGSRVVDAHSLYLEALSELGLVGLILLLAAIGAMLVGTARRCRGPNRVLYAGILAVLAAWVTHAGIDWDWELPAVTIFPLALAGAALASRRPRIAPPGRLLRVVAGIGLLLVVLTPISIFRSQSHLDASLGAIREGDCNTATDDALASIDALPIRPEPFELLAYCNAGAGKSELAERMAQEAIERDPDNWELRYALAIARATGGRDPRAAARKTVELNPRHPGARDLERRLRTDDPEQWGAVGRTAPLLLP